MTSHLFVYGSLMSRAARATGNRLRREARLLGEASLPGRLYRVSWYPAAVESRVPGELVHGELYALTSPAASLKWLDVYEGIRPGHAAGGDYRRVERNVRLVQGGEVLAWVYLWQRPVAGLQRVPDGRWASGG